MLKAQGPYFSVTLVSHGNAGAGIAEELRQRNISTEGSWCALPKLAVAGSKLQRVCATLQTSATLRLSLMFKIP